jgi:hypothetical protein
MSRDYWMTRRKTPIIDKLKQTITIPNTNIEQCFINRSSVYGNGGNDCDVASNVSGTISLTDNITIECWVKVLPKAGATDAYLVRFYGTASSLSFYVSFTSNGAMVEVIGGSVTYPTAILPMNEWVHLATTFDHAGEGKIRLYVNGLLADTENTAGVLATGLDRYILNHDNTAFSFIGYVAEVRMWDVARSAGQIYAAYNKPQGLIGVAPNLLCYARVNDASGSTVSATNGDLVGTLEVNNSWSVSEFPPLIYGASFVVAEWAITLSNNVSLQWPLTMPDDTTGMLCVRWTDSDNEVQRRRLWDLDGVDIAPFPELYAGENLGSSFTIELWNIDGENTCELTEDVTLGISYCTNPTTSYDRTRQAATTVTTDSTLAANFPLTPFPLTFDTQQTY